MDESQFERERRELVEQRAQGLLSEPEFQERLAALLIVRAPADETQAAGVGASDVTTVARVNRPSAFGQPMAPGEMLQEYRLETLIGEGSFGQVWKAYSDVEERHVAVKLLPPALSRDMEEIERVRQCFRRIHPLQHEFICPVYRMGQDTAHGYFLVMKYVEGVGLNTWRASFGTQGPSAEAAVELLRMAGEGLDYAHAQKVLHRDIKPGNLLCSARGDNLQIVDFGLAEQIHSSMSRISGEKGDRAGTPAYMSPEACSGERQDGRSDQYSLACVAYYLFTGRPPFEGNIWAVMSGHRDRMPPPIAALSAAANAALQRGLAKRPEQRYASCAEFAQALRAGVGGSSRTLPSVALPPSPTPRGAGSSQSSLSTPTARWGVPIAPPEPSQPRLPPREPGSSRASVSARTGGSGTLRGPRLSTRVGENWKKPAGELPASGLVALVFTRKTDRVFAVYAGQVLMLPTPYEQWTPLRYSPPGELTCAAATRDGALLALGGSGFVAVLDAVGTQEPRLLRVERGITAMRAIPHTREVCCSTTARKYELLDLTSGKRLREFDAAGIRPSVFAVSRDGKLLAEGTDREIRVSELKGSFFSRHRRVPLPAGQPPAQLESSPAEDRLVVRTTGGDLLAVAPGATTATILPGPPTRHFAISTEGTRVVALTLAGSLRVVDLHSAREGVSVDLPRPGERVALSEGGRGVVALDEGGVIISEKRVVV